MPIDSKLIEGLLDGPAAKAGLGAGAMGLARFVPYLGSALLAMQLLGEGEDIYLQNKMLNAEKEGRKQKALADAMLVNQEANREAADRRERGTAQREMRDFMERQAQRNDYNRRGDRLASILSGTNADVANAYSGGVGHLPGQLAEADAGTLLGYMGGPISSQAGRATIVQQGQNLAC